MFDGTVDSNDNKEEKTREVANTRMYHFGRNFLQLGHDMLWCDHVKVMCVSGRQHCGWQGQHAEETMDSVTL